MRKLDLNITIKDKTVKDVPTFIIEVISNMIARSCNKPNKDGVSTVNSNMETQRRYNKIMNTLESNKQGLVEMDGDDFDYMAKKFRSAEIPINRTYADVLIKIDNIFSQAK
ncbi:MAG TPA: hypothetical protein ENH87_11050 [Pricia antarctica]|uniref:Uncharacterized protein n=1 Tax=Pricia antarctica TaxID=641691 RepID=A0A831QMK5_9FLAO|nr:hypothetical protein [Pricia antarctica]